MNIKPEEYILKRCTNLELDLVNGGINTSKSSDINQKNTVKSEKNNIFDDSDFWGGEILSTKFL